jgi:DNA-binding NarL/FixJ family response regulator
MRVLVVDDHPVVRQMICKLLRREPEAEVVGQAGSAKEALDKSKELRPDIVLLDLSLPDVTGFDAIPELKKACPSSQILLLSEHAATHIVEECLHAGAAGYLVKSDASKELGVALRALSRGEVFLCARFSNKAAINKDSLFA